MRASVTLLAIGLSLAGSTIAADSVVLGRGVSNHFLSIPPCSIESICLDAKYVWVVQAQRTVVGATVVGTVRAISSQHTEAGPEFVRSVELFVLRPIEDPVLRKSSRADYYIVALSLRDSNGRYCLSVKPEEVGLRLDRANLVAGDNGDSCFKAELIGRREI